MEHYSSLTVVSLLKKEENLLIFVYFIFVTQSRMFDFVGQGLVDRSLVSANRCLRGIKTNRFPWYLTLVSANHASSNPGQAVNSLNTP